MDDITFIYHCRMLGVLSDDDVVTWADNRISAEDNPPSWLLDLSLYKQNKNNDPCHFLAVAGANTELNSTEWLILTSGAYFKKACTPEEAVITLKELYCWSESETTELSPLQQNIYSMEHELEHDRVSGKRKLQEFLEPYRAPFDEMLVATTGNLTTQ